MVNNSTFAISTKGTNISHLKPLNTKTTNLITIIFFSLFLDVNEYRGDPWYGHLYRKHDLLLSSCHRAKCVLMTLNGEILDTVYCENNDVLKGTLLDIKFYDVLCTGTMKWHG
jgi:hypothetical protein